jgi:glutaminyl-tRNA synthetase
VLASAKPEVPVQFERQGYFCIDADSKPGKLVFNRTIGLRDTFAKDLAKDKGAA